MRGLFTSEREDREKKLVTLMRAYVQQLTAELGGLEESSKLHVLTALRCHVEDVWRLQGWWVDEEPVGGGPPRPGPAEQVLTMAQIARSSGSGVSLSGSESGKKKPKTKMSFVQPQEKEEGPVDRRRVMLRREFGDKMSYWVTNYVALTFAGEPVYPNMFLAYFLHRCHAHKQQVTTFLKHWRVVLPKRRVPKPEPKHVSKKRYWVLAAEVVQPPSSSSSSYGYDLDDDALWDAIETGQTPAKMFEKMPSPGDLSPDVEQDGGVDARGTKIDPRSTSKKAAPPAVSKSKRQSVGAGMKASAKPKRVESKVSFKDGSRRTSKSPPSSRASSPPAQAFVESEEAGAAIPRRRSISPQDGQTKGRQSISPQDGQTKGRKSISGGHFPGLGAGGERAVSPADSSGSRPGSRGASSKAKSPPGSADSAAGRGRKSIIRPVGAGSRSESKKSVAISDGDVSPALIDIYDSTSGVEKKSAKSAKKVDQSRKSITRKSLAATKLELDIAADDDTPRRKRGSIRRSISGDASDASTPTSSVSSSAHFRTQKKKRASLTSAITVSRAAGADASGGSRSKTRKSITSSMWSGG